MRWKIKTKEIEKTRKAMEEFSKAFNKEFYEEMKKIAIPPIKKFIPQLESFVEVEKDGVVFGIPIVASNFDKFRDTIKKFFPSIKIEPKWKTKTTENLKGYLTALGIKFESVEYIGD